MKSKGFYKMFRYDLRRGIWERRKLYLFFFLLAFLVLSFFSYRVFLLNSDLKDPIQPGLSDLMAELFSGRSSLDLISQSTVSFPIIWFCFHALVFYAVGFFADGDLRSGAATRIIRTRSRALWLSSKYLWCAFTVFFAYLVMLLTVLCFWLGWGAGGIRSCDQIATVFFRAKLSLLPTGLFLAKLILVPFLISLSAAFLQMTLSLFVNPLIPFATALGIAVVSASAGSAFLPFTYTFLFKKVPYVPAKAAPSDTAALLFVFAMLALSFGIGYIFIRKKDIV